MRVLGIETSCDETGVAVYDSDRGLLAHVLYSQVALHADYGGVVPELASRDHIRRVLPLVGGVDLSPLVLLVLIQIALIVLGSLQAMVLVATAG